MKPIALIPAVALALCALPSIADAAMATVPYLGPTPEKKSDVEPNRLDRNRSNSSDNWFANGRAVYPDPYLSLGPSDAATPPERKDKGPGFLNVDPFDPNSVVNSVDRSLYANPYPYDPVYNPYGQGSSIYAPRGGSGVPMGNGIPYGR